MSQNISDFFDNHLHLEADELEGYILGQLEEKSKEGVTLHLSVCSMCRREIETLRPYIDPNIKTTDIVSRYEWGKESKIWINDDKYTLNTLPDNFAVALVEGITLHYLTDKLQEDEKEPGTFLVGIENDTMPLVFPLVFPLSLFIHQFTQAPMVMGVHTAQEYKAFSAPQQSNAMVSSQTKKKVLQYRCRDVVIDILTNGQGQIFLYVLPPGEVDLKSKTLEAVT